MSRLNCYSMIKLFYKKNLPYFTEYPHNILISKGSPYFLCLHRINTARPHRIKIRYTGTSLCVFSRQIINFPQWASRTAYGRYRLSTGISTDLSTSTMRFSTALNLVIVLCISVITPATEIIRARLLKKSFFSAAF